MSNTSTHIKTEKQFAPALRFKEFSEEWVRTKVRDALKIENNKRTPISAEERKKIHGEYPYYGPTKIQDYINKYEYDGIYALIGEDGDHFLKYRDMSMTQIAKGKFNVNNHAHVIKGTAFCSTEWFYWYFNQKNIYRHLTRQGAGRYKLNKAALEFLPIEFPSIKEQQKIAAFLSAVDEKIQQLTKKKELLEQYKKGLMQQLFSGQLRFKPDQSSVEVDENGNNYPDWEEKRLGDFMLERNTKTPKNDKYPLMAFIQNKGVAPKGDRYNREFLVNDGDGKKYKQTEYGDFIYSSNNLETGSIGLNRYGSACISPVYSIFEIDDSCDYKFVSEYFLRKRFIYKMIRFRQGVVYGQWRIHESEFLKIEEKIPCLAEQQKIAAYLSSIDAKIENVNQQVTQTQTFKKGLLQKMFV
jgi:type I restriction enzyme S subunit